MCRWRWDRPRKSFSKEGASTVLSDLWPNVVGYAAEAAKGRRFESSEKPKLRNIGGFLGTHIGAILEQWFIFARKSFSKEAASTVLSDLWPNVAGYAEEAAKGRSFEGSERPKLPGLVYLKASNA